MASLLIYWDIYSFIYLHNHLFIYLHNGLFIYSLFYFDFGILSPPYL